MKLVHTISRLLLIFVFALVLTIDALAQTGDKPQAKPASKKAVRQLVLSNEPWTGDFEQMLERRMIRALVPYSRSLYFNDKGRERGISADNVREFERWINKKYSKKLGKRPLTIYIITTTRDKLLPGVVKGVGDVAIGNLTVTEDRLKTVDFVSPKGSRSMNELIVSGPTSPAIDSVDDLSGRTVHVRNASSYHESLDALNERFKKEGKSAVKLVFVPEALEDEDMMEMVNAGLLENIIVDDWKAKMWAQILPNIQVNEQAVLREGGMVGTAIRKNSLELEAEILDFYNSYIKKQRLDAYRMKQYMSRVKQIKNSTGASELNRFNDTLALFEKYGQQYNFDPLMLAAQGYQESQLNQNAKSQVGAIGVMQVMPTTGKELKVGDIRIIERKHPCRCQVHGQAHDEVLQGRGFHG